MRVTHINLSLELADRLYGSRCGDNHPSSELLTLHTTQQSTHVISSLAMVKHLVEHLDTSQSRLEVGTKTNNLNITALGDDAPLNTSSRDGATAGDGEDI